MANSSNNQPEKNNWVQELRRVREEAITQRIEEQAAGETGTARAGNRASSLLREVNGLEYLRDIQKEVLNGQGVLERFENKGKYERAFALIWDGSISGPSRPKDTEKAEQYLVIGAGKNELYVNNEIVSPATSEKLQEILLQVIRNPNLLHDNEVEPKAPSSMRRTFTKVKWAIILILVLINFMLVGFGILLLSNTRIFTLFTW